MKLTFEQVKACTKGAMEVREENGAAAFYRFSPAQSAPFDLPDCAEGRFRYTCDTTASVMVDFWTDADAITLTLSGTCLDGRPEIPVEILENGTMVQSAKVARTVDSTGQVVPYGPATFRFPLSKGEKRVTVCPFYLTVNRISDVILENATTFRPYEHAKTMLAFGDSITQGHICAHASLTYVNQVAMLLDAEVHNYGIGGETFWDKKIVPGTYPRCDFVTVAYGTNDFSKSEYDVFLKNSRAFFSALAEQHPGVPIFAITPIWRADWDSERKIPSFFAVEDQLRKIAEEIPTMKVIPGYDLVPHDVNLYSDRRLHPDDGGFSHYGKNLIKEVRAMLEKE